MNWQKACLCGLVGTGLAWAATGAEYSENLLVVKFRQKEVHRLVHAGDSTPLDSIQRAVNLPAGAKLQESQVARLLKQRRKIRPAGRNNDADIDFSHFFYVSVPAGYSSESLLALLRGNPLVEYAARDPIGSAGATIPDDPNITLQWALGSATGHPGRIWAPEAWDLTTGTASVIVAVMDTGCNTNKPEFAGRTVPGYDFMNNRELIEDDHGHGTAVASILCATGNNAYQGAGVDWNCRLMPLKVLGGSSATGSLSIWASAMYWAVTNGAKVINLSAGFRGPWDANCTLLADAVSNAVAHGVVVVASVGNDTNTPLRFPASMPEVMGIGAITTTGRVCHFSNWGTNLDLVAPGSNIYYLTTNEGYNAWWGTSFAAPHVSGAASLICSLRPDLTSSQVCSILCAGAVEGVSGDTNDVAGYDLRYGWGQLNVYHSLLLAQTRVNELAISNEEVQLRWMVPGNATNRNPYVVEYAPAMTGEWSVSTNVIELGTNQAQWADQTPPGIATQRFYRVRIKSF